MRDSKSEKSLTQQYSATSPIKTITIINDAINMLSATNMLSSSSVEIDTEHKKGRDF